MFSKDRAFGMTQQPFQITFGFPNWIGIARESREKVRHFSNFPADVNRGDEVKTVASESLGGFVFEILNALIELIDFLDRPRPFDFEAWLDDLVLGLPKGGHDGDFGFAHLKRE